MLRKTSAYCAALVVGALAAGGSALAAPGACVGIENDAALVRLAVKDELSQLETALHYQRLEDQLRTRYFVECNGNETKSAVCGDLATKLATARWQRRNNEQPVREISYRLTHYRHVFSRANSDLFNCRRVQFGTDNPPVGGPTAAPDDYAQWKRIYAPRIASNLLPEYDPAIDVRQPNELGDLSVRAVGRREAPREQAAPATTEIGSGNCDHYLKGMLDQPNADQREKFRLMWVKCKQDPSATSNMGAAPSIDPPARTADCSQPPKMVLGQRTPDATDCRQNSLGSLADVMVPPPVTPEPPSVAPQNSGHSSYAMLPPQPATAAPAIEPSVDRTLATAPAREKMSRREKEIRDRLARYFGPRVYRY